MSIFNPPDSTRRWEIKWTWEAYKQPTGLFVINEHRSDQQGFTQWGPMPESIVEPFLQVRKAEINATAERMSDILESWNLGVSRRNPDGSPAPDSKKAGD